MTWRRIRVALVAYLAWEARHESYRPGESVASLLASAATPAAAVLILRAAAAGVRDVGISERISLARALRVAVAARTSADHRPLLLPRDGSWAALVAMAGGAR